MCGVVRWPSDLLADGTRKTMNRNVNGTPISLACRGRQYVPLPTVLRCDASSDQIAPGIDRCIGDV